MGFAFVLFERTAALSRAIETIFAVFDSILHKKAAEVLCGYVAEKERKDTCSGNAKSESETTICAVNA